MKPPAGHGDTLRFGAFTLLAHRRELLHRGERVSIGSRAFDLLQALVARRGRLATKDELLAEVWAGTVVDENNLAAQVVTLRRILAADARLAGCVQTIPGRGYVFLADVEHPGASDAGPSRGTEPRAQPASDDGEAALSLVVLPFASLGDDVEQSHFAQGLSHTVATDLSRIAGLTVMSPTTAATFDGRSADARHVSRELAVQYVLAGSVQRIDGRLRINAHLVDGGTGRQIWSDLFDGDGSNLLAFQDRITGRIANSIGREIFVAAARGGLARHVDPGSFDFLMRGIAADNLPQSLAILRQQEALFARAVELDPRNAEAHARLARARLLQLTQVHAPKPADEQLMAGGIQAAETAVALDPYNARAHCAMGLVHVLQGDFERAVLENEAAIALDRNFAIAHNNLANSLVHLGRGAEALPAAATALRLDPRGPSAGAFLTTQGFAQLLLAAHDDAVASFRRAQSANPLLPRAHVGAAVSLALVGDVPAAKQAAAALLRIVPGYRLSETMDGSRPSSTPAYRRFVDEVLARGAGLAGLPV